MMFGVEREVTSHGSLTETENWAQKQEAVASTRTKMILQTILKRVQIGTNGIKCLCDVYQGSGI